MAVTAAPNRKISFAVFQDPSSDRVAIDLPLQNKLTKVMETSIVTWEVTNTLRQPIDVQIVGLDNTMQQGFQSTLKNLASGDRQSITGTVTEPVSIRSRRGYSIWVRVGLKWTSVDPDLQIDPPAGGGRVVVLTGVNVDINVTIDKYHCPTHVNPVSAHKGDTLTWSIKNVGNDPVTFAVGFANREVTFTESSVDVPPNTQTPVMLVGTVGATGNATDEEVVIFGQEETPVNYQFVFSPPMAQKKRKG